MKKMGMKSLLKKELEKISLSEEEISELKELANGIVNKLVSEGFRAEIGGSMAKGTMIRKGSGLPASCVKQDSLHSSTFQSATSQDVDLFVVFSEEKDIEKLERVLEKLNFNFKVVHGSRDYFQIREKNVIFELIPVKKFESAGKVENITDFSLIHVNYVRKKLKKNPKLAGEIKIAKAFCYAQNCYGAESYIKGFSGYALELLIIYYGGFVNFIKKIRPQEVIDIEKQFKNSKMILSELNESKLQSPIILIDPTYKFRNVAAGLSEETFNNFLLAARKFLKSPSEKFFELKKIEPEKLKKLAKTKKAKFVELRLHTNKQEGDIAGTKMKKFFEFIVKELERKEQKIIASEFKYDWGEEAFGYLIIKEKEEIEIKGPPIENRVGVQGFRKVRKKIYKKKGFWFAKEKVSLDDIFAFLRRYEDEMSVSFEVFD